MAVRELFRSASSMAASIGSWIDARYGINGWMGRTSCAPTPTIWSLMPCQASEGVRALVVTANPEGSSDAGRAAVYPTLGVWWSPVFPICMAGRYSFRLRWLAPVGGRRLSPVAPYMDLTPRCGRALVKSVGQEPLEHDGVVDVGVVCCVDQGDDVMRSDDFTEMIYCFAVVLEFVLVSLREFLHPGGVVVPPGSEVGAGCDPF